MCVLVSGNHLANASRKRKIGKSGKGVQASKKIKPDPHPKDVKPDPHAKDEKPNPHPKTTQMVDGLLPLGDGVDLAGAPPCPFKMDSIKFNLYLNCLVHRRSHPISHLFPGTVDSLRDSRFVADRQKLLDCLGFKGLPNPKAVKARANVINEYRQRIHAKKFPIQPDEVLAKLPRLSNRLRTGVQMHNITQEQLATIASDDYVSGDILEYFIGHFASKIKNPKIHIPSPLFTAALFYDQESSTPTKLDFARISQVKNQSILVPKGLFQEGGTVIMPFNYPVNSHWFIASVNTKQPINKPPEVFDFRIMHGHEVCREKNDAIVAPLLAQMMETVMTSRFPNPEKPRHYIVKSCQCENQSTNGCAVRVVTHVILHLMGLNNNYKLNMTFDKALRDWMFHYILKYKCT